MIFYKKNIYDVKPYGLCESFSPRKRMPVAKEESMFRFLYVDSIDELCIEKNNIIYKRDTVQTAQIIIITPFIDYDYYYSVESDNYKIESIEKKLIGHTIGIELKYFYSKTWPRDRNSFIPKMLESDVEWIEPRIIDIFNQKDIMSLYKSTDYWRID